MAGLLLDVVTLKFGVPVFVLSKATRTGEPIAMFGGGAITVRPFAAATATYTVPVVLLPIVSLSVAVNVCVPADGRGGPGEGVGRRIKVMPVGNVLPAVTVTASPLGALVCTV